MTKPDVHDRMFDYMDRMLVTRGYSPRTQKTYLRWTKQFVSFLGHPHPNQIGTEEIKRYLDHLANERKLASSTRNQAAAAIVFLIREVLESDAADSIPRSKGPKRVPVVLSHREVTCVLRELSGRMLVAAKILYGTGIRVDEALCLRIKDVDFDLERINVQEAKGGKGRVLMLPTSLRTELRQLIRGVERQHRSDTEHGTSWVSLPGALHLKKPQAGYELGWQFLFRSRTLTKDPATGRRGRYHMSPSALQKAFRAAVKRSGLSKPAACHSMRHSFATQLLRDGYDLPTLQKLLGHKDIRTTMIYAHVVDQVGFGVRSPLDRGDPSNP